MEQIQFLLGHASVQTNGTSLVCKQNFRHLVKRRFALGAIEIERCLTGF